MCSIKTSIVSAIFVTAIVLATTHLILWNEQICCFFLIAATCLNFKLKLICFQWQFIRTFYPDFFNFAWLQCDQIWRNFTPLVTLWKSLDISWGVYFVFGKILAPTLWIFHAFWQIALLQMATFWLNSLAIRSHWRHATPTLCIDICKMLILIGRNSAATNTAKRI